jgi:hypothetical protein
MSFQMVGTAPEKVGRSAPISLHRGSACKNLPGRMKSAPAIQPAYGSPHAFAWNIGTMGSMRSLSSKANAPPRQAAKEWRNVERWL